MISIQSKSIERPFQSDVNSIISHNPQIVINLIVIVTLKKFNGRDSNKIFKIKTIIKIYVIID